ncbi:hypothetical protein KA001_00255 [Patescibacteria group bacterium]|nr:hypothetical protein [Patescibacteria group bacterium]
MIYYFYGNNYEALYAKRIEFLKSGFLIFNPLEKNLYNEILSIGFFEQKKKLIVDLFRESEGLKDINYKALKKITKDCEIVFISLKEDKNIVAISDKILEFPILKNNDIFLLIDSVYSGNTSMAINLYEKFKNKDLEHYVFSMLFFPIKNILYYLFDINSFKKLHPFVSKKTADLSLKIGSTLNLEKILYFLCQADIKIKTGSTQKNIFISYIMYVKLLLQNVETAPEKKLY